MKERWTSFDSHKLLVLIPENESDESYLAGEQMIKIMNDHNVRTYQCVTAEKFSSRLKNNSEKRVPIVMRTSSYHGVYDTVKSLVNI